MSSVYGPGGPPKGYSNPRVAPSAANGNQVCQRCYVVGHFTYECKATGPAAVTKRPRVANDDAGPPPDTRNPLLRSDDPGATRYTVEEVAEVRRVLRLEVREELRKTHPHLFAEDVSGSDDSDDDDD